MSNKLPNLISFSGRKGSGKSLLAKICQNEYGYKPISFAYNLKLLICQCLNISLDDLNKNKDNMLQTPIYINNFNIINEHTNIPLDIIKNSLSNKYFNSFREILQFIGTDLIRNYNKNWHIEKFKQTICNNPNTKFCVDDNRFINEMNLIKQLNGVSFYIINNKNNNLDSHISENELSPEHCDYTLINNFDEHFINDFKHIILKIN